jgi:hypothetical protein
LVEKQISGEVAIGQAARGGSFAGSARYKKVCATNPDASMATNGRNRRLEQAYKQHAVVTMSAASSSTLR